MAFVSSLGGALGAYVGDLGALLGQGGYQNLLFAYPPFASATFEAPVQYTADSRQQTADSRSRLAIDHWSFGCWTLVMLTVHDLQTRTAHACRAPRGRRIFFY